MTSVRQLDPDTIQPQGQLVLCVAYTRPEYTESGLIIPEPFRVDPFWMYYEVISSGPKCAKLLGMKLAPGDIIRTDRLRPPIDSGYEDGCGRRLYFVSCTIKVPRGDKLVEVGNITGIIPNTWAVDTETPAT